VLIHSAYVAVRSQISGSSFRVALAESLKMIDVVVAIVSEDPSEWVLFEIGLAQDAGVPSSWRWKEAVLLRLIWPNCRWSILRRRRTRAIR
jgi:hypothetical protein